MASYDTGSGCTGSPYNFTMNAHEFADFWGGKCTSLTEIWIGKGQSVKTHTTYWKATFSGGFAKPTCSLEASGALALAATGIPLLSVFLLAAGG